MSAAPRLYTAMQATSAEIVAGMLRVLYPDARTVLDATYGNGGFWDGTAPVDVTGMDADPARALHVVADFRATPFAAASFDVVVFDPPYHTDMGRGRPSVMGARFGTFATIPELQAAIERGCREAWRVARLGVIVKVQDYVHASRVQWLPRWVCDVLGEPYDRVIQTRKHKILDPKWKGQYSAYRNHAEYLAFRKDGSLHRERPTSGRGVTR